MFDILQKVNVFTTNMTRASSADIMESCVDCLE
jgi:hypothetical protein